jgi:hypothetical protein
VNVRGLCYLSVFYLEGNFSFLTDFGMTSLWGWPHLKVGCCEVIFLESILG